MVKRKIAVATGTRAEYGLLRPLIERLHASEETELQLVVTGMHLSPEFGLTFRQIEEDGFEITRKVESLLSSDTPSGIGKSTGLGLIGFADALADLRPDLLVLLGDRFEILAAAIAALYARIPVAHIHGGETTEGAFDEGIRHAITKMAHLHFVAAEAYRRRVIQLGEDPERVFQVGALAIDGIRETKLLGRQELESDLGFDFGAKTLLITFHPVTLESNTSEQQIDALLNACRRLDPDVHFIFTMPNADTEGRIIIEKIEAFVAEMGSRAMVATSLGQLRYWSAMSQVDAVVGNSSSGLLEAPTFKVPTVNIGDRQRGRIMAESVLNCDPTETAIYETIQQALGERFQALAKAVVNPLGEGGGSETVFNILSTASLSVKTVKKTFHDVSFDFDEALLEKRHG